MGFSIMLRGAEKLVPAEYWCPYGKFKVSLITEMKSYQAPCPDSSICEMLIADLNDTFTKTRQSN